MKKATPVEIVIRNFARADIEPTVKYWTENSVDFWRERGVDKTKLMSKDEFMAAYEKMFIERGDVRSAATIVFRENPIGVHTLTDLVENESAIFHAHIWSDSHCGLGIAFYSYLMASEFFMKKLKLRKIVFKTPKINKAANQVKAKIGIPCLGDTVYEAPILFEPLQANLYEIDLELLGSLKIRHGLI